MGLLRRDDDEQPGRRFQMREKLASIGDDSWIEDENGERLYKSTGRRWIRDTSSSRTRRERSCLDPGEEAQRARQDGDRARRRDGRDDPKALVGDPRRFSIAVEGGEDLSAKGNVLDHDYEIKRDGDVIASVSKEVVPGARHLRRRNRGGEDEALLLAVTVALDR